MIYIIVFLWCLIGNLCYIYWWTKDNNFRVEDIKYSLGIGLTGPIAFLIGWLIHGEELLDKRKILIKKRNNEKD